MTGSILISLVGAYLLYCLGLYVYKWCRATRLIIKFRWKWLTTTNPVFRKNLEGLIKNVKVTRIKFPFWAIKFKK